MTNILIFSNVNIMSCELFYEGLKTKDFHYRIYFKLPTFRFSNDLTDIGKCFFLDAEKKERKKKKPRSLHPMS